MKENPPSILVVDDQPKLGRLVAELLRRLGFVDVDACDNGQDALRLLREKHYGLVISDLDMDPMNGLQLLREIRADKDLFRTAFLLTESEITFEEVNALHQAGADAFLLKPFDLVLLKAKLKTVMRSRAGRRQRSPETSGQVSEQPTFGEIFAKLDL